uniref:Uncharacterized protein n=1 Tax=Trichogramma kaykai TaxID=54128 RepID=A0ABD2VWE1_9HYME
MFALTFASDEISSSTVVDVKWNWKNAQDHLIFSNLDLDEITNFEFIIHTHTHAHTHELRVEPINACAAQRGGQKRRQQEALQALGWVCEAFEKWSHVFIVRLRFGHYTLSRYSFARIRVSTIACVIALLCKLPRFRSTDPCAELCRSY